MKQNRSLPIFITIILFIVSGCSNIATTTNDVNAAAETVPTIAPTFTATPTVVPTETPTLMPTATNEPTATPTQVLVMVGPGPIHCPILLYHRIVPGQGDNPYNLTPEDFGSQMRYLSENGYSTISIEQLRDAIVNGAELPEKPIVISFDDGDISVYKNAFPVMQKYGFTGVAYLVTTYLETEGYMKVRQVKELIRAGWEIGSHSARHQDVSKTEYLDTEIVGSKADLEKLLDIKVRSFAYPFGAYSPTSMKKVSEWYSNAVGLGVPTIQKESNLYYLWRRPVDNGTTLDQFIEFLK